MKADRCPLCGGAAIAVFLERNAVPVHQHVVCSSTQEARDFPKGDLRCALCETCGFIFNASFYPEYLCYSAVYDNSQTHSSYFRTYMEDIARRLTNKYELHGKDILEIGCGKGAFLRMLCRGGRNRGVGFDPSYIGPDAEENERAKFVRSFFSPEKLAAIPDFICCRHVIEHIQELPPMLESVRRAIEAKPGAVVYFETPDVNWIFENTAFWDFFYEHCSYYTAETLAHAFENCGFEVLDVYRAFEGQYLGIEARVRRNGGLGAGHSAAPRHVPALKEQSRRFVSASDAKIGACERRIRNYRETGGCALWGAGAKGVTFANIVDPDARLIDCLIDINPAKQGGFVAGTGHPIVPPSALSEFHFSGLLNMNPNYFEENHAMLRRMGLGMELISA
ncbi:MAG: class I SAM-dependent methyltransferase [Acidobacteriota bacterium]|nr:class I SAM-dependent methyltransferase [Acidobacteriota bacterium]